MGATEEVPERGRGARRGSGRRRGETVALPRLGAGGDGGPADFGSLPRTIGYVLRRAQLAVFQDITRTFAGYDIRPAQYSVLTIIGRNPGLTQTQVAEALGIQRTNFVALLDGLEARGLARRAPAASDRRSHALHLTPEGEGLLARLQRLEAEHERRLVERIGPGNHELLLDLLRRLGQDDDPSPDPA